MTVTYYSEQNDECKFTLETHEVKALQTVLEMMVYSTIGPDDTMLKMDAKILMWILKGEDFSMSLQTYSVHTYKRIVAILGITDTSPKVVGKIELKENAQEDEDGVEFERSLFEHTKQRSILDNDDEDTYWENNPVNKDEFDDSDEERESAMYDLDGNPR